MFHTSRLRVRGARLLTRSHFLLCFLAATLMGKGKAKRSSNKGQKGGSPHDHASHARSTISKKQKKKQQRQQRQSHEQSGHSMESDGSPREPKAPSGGCPYSLQRATLLLGEGDFSFGAALALVWGNASNMTATVYDEEEAARQKYSSLAENVDTIRSLGGTVVFGVDAAKAAAHKAVRNRGPYDRIIFNFPCAPHSACRHERVLAAPRPRAFHALAPLAASLLSPLSPLSPLPLPGSLDPTWLLSPSRACAATPAPASRIRSETSTPTRSCCARASSRAPTC